MKLLQLQLWSTNGRNNHLPSTKKHSPCYRTSVWLPRNFSLAKSPKHLRQGPNLRLVPVFRTTLGSALRLTTLSNKPNALVEVEVFCEFPLAMYYTLFSYRLFDKALLLKLLFTLTFLNNCPLRPVRTQQQGVQRFNPALAYFSKRYL